MKYTCEEVACGLGPSKHDILKLKFGWPQVGPSPGNEVIVDHCKWTKMLTKVFQWNLTPWGYVKPPIKPHPNPPWEKPRFRVKSKMAANKPVIYIYF